MNKRFLRIILILLVMIFLMGCSHALEVKNINQFTNTCKISLKKPITIGIIPKTEAEDYNSKKLVKEVAEALGKYSANIILPYYTNSTTKADVIVNIGWTTDYSGSVWNLPISFPGFLIFTSAWNGFVYEVNHSVNISLINSSNNSTIDSWDVPIKLNLRHASFDRTWPTGTAIIGFGAFPLLGGFYFITYDNDITPVLAEKINSTIGDFIAQDIVIRINNGYQLPSIQPVSYTTTHSSSSISDKNSSTADGISNESDTINSRQIIEDQQIINTGVKLAKVLNVNPIPICQKDDGSTFIPAGYVFNTGSEGFILKDGDMLINATNKTINAMDIPLHRGEYAIIENNNAKKGDNSLIPQ